jgi:asparagine synthase (glutamine-hydrolysing)
MRDQLRHRGPDDAGLTVSHRVALGSRRLAILDLSERGHMPMSLGERYWIAYNGEVYNYRELREPLLRAGYAFRSDTDTEVLLALYAEHGPSMLSRLNGMFAFAIWDEQEQSLFIARDRLGVKPLYYAVHDGRFVFASEQKALFAAGVPCGFDPEVWGELLAFRYVAGERTPFRGVSRLLPGHYLIWRDGAFTTHRWWNLAERAAARRDALPDDPAAWYAETFDSAIQLRRISDVPIGVLLSGGLDSGSVAAATALQAGGGVSSFTVSFAEEGFDETALAREVAEQYGLQFHTMRVPAEALVQLLCRASWHNDEPLTHGNDAHLLAISEFAKPRVTVLLSGEGADETLGGYVRYRPLQYPTALRLARPGLRLAGPLVSASLRLTKLVRLLGLDGADAPVLFNASDLVPGTVKLRPGAASDHDSSFAYRQRVLAEAKALYPGEPVRQAMYLDQHTYLCSILDRNDRMTMAASIECRVPFLDFRLVETAAALPSHRLLSGRENKHLLRRALSHRLPESVRHGRKWGFGVPWTRYLREVPAFNALVQGLATSEFVATSPLDPSWLRTVADDFLRGSKDHTALIRQLFILQVWHDAVIRRAGQPVA